MKSAINLALTRAKLELHLFTLLENTNKEFTIRWKKCQKTNEQPISFQECAQNYQKIMELIDHNQGKKNISDLLKSYYLEAWFGKIQSVLNDLPQNPCNEASLKENDKKVEELSKSFDDLKNQAEKFNILIKKSTPSLSKKDYEELLEKINTFYLSWDKTLNERKAIYYYNCAENLIEETTSKNSDYILKIKLFESAIACLDFSIFLYKKIENIEHAEETLQRQKKIRKQLKQAQSLNPILKIEKISTKLELSFVKTSNVSQLAGQKKPIEYPTKDPQINSMSTLPIKKRKNWINFDVETPAPKKLHLSSLSENETKITNLVDEKKLMQKNPYISPSQVKLSFDILSEIQEKKVKHQEEKLEKMLIQAPMDNPFRFYGQLFFDLSKQLKVCSKESSNHTLLTQLSWLDIAEKLFSLISNKNQRDHTTFEAISDRIRSISSNHKKILDIISSQKRGEAYPTYDLNDLQLKILPKLLIKESIDYYDGLDAFNLRCDATRFLDLISDLIKHYSFANTFEEIKKVIQFTNKHNENLFCAKLLRELVKFHICDENESWRNISFSSTNKYDLIKEYLRILTISQCFAEGLSKDSQTLKQKIQQLKNYLLQQLPQYSLTSANNTQSNSSFFQQSKQPNNISMELLIKTLQEHFQCLIKYKAPTLPTQTLYKDLLHFIQVHCKEQTAIFSPRVLF